MQGLSGKSGQDEWWKRSRILNFIYMNGTITKCKKQQFKYLHILFVWDSIFKLNFDIINLPRNNNAIMNIEWRFKCWSFSQLWFTLTFTFIYMIGWKLQSHTKLQEFSKSDQVRVTSSKYCWLMIKRIALIISW